MVRSVSAFFVTVFVALSVPGLAAANHWRTEADLRNEVLESNRQTFVFDPGRGDVISRDDFLRADFVAFYTGEEFDRNYLTWAPLIQVNPDGHEWHGCDVGHSAGTFCPSDQMHHRSVRTNVPEGNITAIAWGGSFISVVCGNHSVGGSKAGPMPRIEGTKFNDRDRNGVRGANEPGLSGWTIRLLYNGVQVATTTTSSGGSYSFALNANSLPIGAGTYRVVEVEQSGWAATAAPAAFNVPLGSEAQVFSGRDFGNRLDLAPALEVLKTASPDVVDEPGAEVEYSLSVRNVSLDPDDTVTISTLVDDLHTELGECVGGAQIAVGATWTCRFRGMVRGNAGDVVEDTVSVTAHDRDGREARGQESASVQLRDVAPSVRVTKTPDRASVPEPGAAVTFRLAIANESTASSDPVTITSIVDSAFGDLAGAGSCDSGATLAVGAVYECQFTHHVAGDGNTSHSNTVRVTAVDDEGSEAQAEALAAVAVHDVLPSITATKTSEPATIPATGAMVTFTVSVLNESVEPVVLMTLHDDTFGNLAGRGSCATGAVLPVGEAYSCAFAVFLDGVPWDDHTNVLTARAEDNELNVAHASAAASVEYVVPPTHDCKVTGGGKVALGSGAVGQFNNNVHTPPDVRVSFIDRSAVGGFAFASQTITSVFCSPDRRTAAIFGVGTIDGTAYEFRVDAVDAGEPPFTDTYRIRIANGYDSGTGTLTEGNIQIHK